MSSIIEIMDRGLIERFLRRDVELHIYELGDLDPFFWPHTRWFGIPHGSGGLRALALLYEGSHLPTLIALDRHDEEAMTTLVEALNPHLPGRLYAHLSPGLIDRIGNRWSPRHHGRHIKMVLFDKAKISTIDSEGTERLGLEDLDSIRKLYRESYPANWFIPRMLETGEYFGIRKDGSLVCAAGVHVCSREQRVAAIGNITTAHDWRGRGLARRVVARLCRSLFEHVEIVGLNVKADNLSALACYEHLGFAEAARYDEYMMNPARCAPLCGNYSRESGT